MNKIIYILVFLLALSTSCVGQKKEEAVKQTFENYKAAILNDKGNEAVTFVDSRTIRYYNDILNLIKNADSTEIKSLSILDKLLVFSIRHQVDRKDILSFDGKRLLIHAIKIGLIDKNTVINTSIGEVTINQDFAKGQFITNGQKTPLYFHFYNENNQWKIDLTSIFPTSIVALKKITEDSGQGENEFIFSLLEMLTGIKPGEDIWEQVR